MEFLSNHGVITTILFDLDNTLISTRKADKLACSKLAEILWEKYAVPADRASIASSTFLRAFRKCPDNPSMDLVTWRHLLWQQALGDQYSHLADVVYPQWLELRYHYLTLTPEIQNLIHRLRKHYLLGLITNGPTSAQWEKIHRLELKTLFDIILVSGDLPWEKPHQKIFLKACNYLGVEPQQCIMVGDKLETDILGGIKAKLGGTVWVPLKSSELDEKDPAPDYVLENVTELIDVLPKNPVLRSRSTKPNKFGSYVNNKRFSLPDFEDCNSNSSDGS